MTQKAIKPPINDLSATIFQLLISNTTPNHEKHEKLLGLFTFRNLLRLKLFQLKKWIWCRRTGRKADVPTTDFTYYGLVSVDAKGNFVAVGFITNQEMLWKAVRGHFTYPQTSKVLIINVLTKTLAVYNRPEHYVISQN